MNNNSTTTVETGFIFRTRSQCIDWKKLAGVDINRIEKQIDVHTLQDNIINVTFCNIEAELDVSTIDCNFIKLFKLSQFIIEYLLHCQDYLTNISKSTDDKLNKNLAENKALKVELAESKALVKKVQKENRKRRLLLEQQQKNGITKENEDYFQCYMCRKVFMNFDYLQAHISRRHGTVEKVTQSSELVDGLNQRCLEVEQKLEKQQQSLANITTQEKNEILKLEKSMKVEIENWRNELDVKNKNSNIKADVIEELEKNLKKQILDLQQEQLNKQNETEAFLREVLLNEMDKVKAISINEYQSFTEKNSQLLSKEVKTWLQNQLNNHKDALENEIKSHIQKSRHKIDKMKEQNDKQLKCLLTETQNTTATDKLQKRPISPIKRRKNQSKEKNAIQQPRSNPETEVIPFSDVFSSEPESSEISESLSEIDNSVLTANFPTSIFSYPRTAKALENNPNLLKGLKHELDELLKDKMVAINIAQDCTSLTNATASDKHILIQNSGVQYRKKFDGFNDIRHKIEQEIDSIARRKASTVFSKAPAMTKPHTSTDNILAKSMGSENSKSPIKQKKEAIASPIDTEEIAPKLAHKPILSSTARTSSSSSDESFGISLSDLSDIKKTTDRTNLVVDIIAVDKKRKLMTQANVVSDEGSDWDSISDIEALPEDENTVFKMRSKPPGKNVASLARNIEKQLSGHRNKPIGGIDLTNDEQKTKPYSMSKKKEFVIEDDELSSLSFSEDFSDGNAVVKTSRQSSIKSGSDVTSVWGSTTS